MENVILQIWNFFLFLCFVLFFVLFSLVFFFFFFFLFCLLVFLFLFCFVFFFWYESWCVDIQSLLTIIWRVHLQKPTSAISGLNWIRHPAKVAYSFAKTVKCHLGVELNTPPCESAKIFGYSLCVQISYKSIKWRNKAY